MLYKSDFATLRFSMAFVWGHCISCQLIGTIGNPVWQPKSVYFQITYTEGQVECDGLATDR